MPRALSRRDALRSITTAAVTGLGLGLGVSPTARAAGARKMTIDLVCGNLGANVSLTQAIELAARHGFESVAPDANALAKLSRTEMTKLRGDLAAKSLVWGAAALEVDFRGDDAKFEEGMSRLPAQARALEQAGATRMGTWLSPASRNLTFLTNFRQHARRLRRIAIVLGDSGLRFGLEYVGPKTSWTSATYPFVHTMAEARELIDAIDRDNVGLVLDSWHWYTAHETLDDLKRLSNREIVACDLNDAPAGIPVDQQKDLVRELPCATGVIDLKGFLGALQAIGYDGPVRAEPFKAELRTLPPEESVTRAAASMKQAFALIGG